MISKETKERIVHLFKTADTIREDDFTDWELNFIISIEEQFERKGYLTDPQLDKLEEVLRDARQR